jgi:1,4-alpha-glucan branching enzyme
MKSNKKDAQKCGAPAKAAKGRKKVRFELAAEPGSQVFLAGTFNNWHPSACPMSACPASGRYLAELMVPAGKHEYKFVVNGVWMPDPACPESVPDGCGAVNSVRQV